MHRASRQFQRDDGSGVPRHRYSVLIQRGFGSDLMDTILEAVEKRERERAGSDDVGAPERNVPSAYDVAQDRHEPLISPVELGGLEAQPVAAGNSADVVLVAGRQSFGDLGIGFGTTAGLALIEEFRYIKRPLIVNAQPDNVSDLEHPNLVMVSSAFPGEGKTFTAINLALSIATEREKTVLLVDSDVAKPHISRILGVKNRPGLIDLLTDESLKFSDVLVKTDVPNLSLLPAGRRHEHATELLASDAMRRLAHEISNRYADRIIVFDSPPLLLTSESQVLSAVMGQIVLVVEEGRTSQAAVMKVVGMLDQNKAIGFVLNKSERASDSRYYGKYGYYRAYGGGGASEAS